MALQQTTAVEEEEVKGLQVPLDHISLILPDSVVVQILVAKEYMDINEGPGWLMGMVEWQNRFIPVLSFEMASGRDFSKPKDMRLIVLKSLNDYEKIPFYALFLSAIPHPVRFTNENLSAVENANSSSPLIHAEVLVYGEQSSIPNLDVLEEMLGSQNELISSLVEQLTESSKSES